jgi:hypothetical protein
MLASVPRRHGDHRLTLGNSRARTTRSWDKSSYGLVPPGDRQDCVRPRSSVVTQCQVANTWGLRRREGDYGCHPVIEAGWACKPPGKYAYSPSAW